MSVASLSLDALERGEYNAPAEQASVNVTNGPNAGAINVLGHCG